MGGENMGNCLSTTGIYYKDIEEYKTDINAVIENMIANNERLVFSVVAEKASITPFVIRQYPDLRNYILQTMVNYKEIQVLKEKIEKAVASLTKSNKSLTFLAIINKCKFDSNMVYQNQYIKEKIRSLIAEQKKRSSL